MRGVRDAEVEKGGKEWRVPSVKAVRILTRANAWRLLRRRERFSDERWEREMEAEEGPRPPSPFAYDIEAFDEMVLAS